MCTNLMISVPSNPNQHPHDPTQTYVSGRALEMPGVIEQSVYVLPVNQSWPLTTPPSDYPTPTTLTWSSKFGFVGIAPSGSSWQTLPTFNDGINTAGLSVGALWLAPGTDYPSPPPPSAKPANNQVSFLDFPAWILGNFGSVKDFLNGLTQILVVGPPQGNKYYVPLHYVVTDNTGQSAVIEFVGGQTNTYPSTNAVLTNWPTYDWQLANVKNYAHLSLIGTGTSTSGEGAPVGSSLVGLPGDSLSASRFVKASILSQGFAQLPPSGAGWLPAPGAFPKTQKTPGFAGPEQTAVVVALQLTQLCMGTPYGMMLQRVKNSPDNTGTPEIGSTLTYGDYTMWTSVRDHTNRKYYFMSALSGILTLIDLNTINFTTTPVYPGVSLPIMPQANVAWNVDATKMLQPAPTT